MVRRRGRYARRPRSTCTTSGFVSYSDCGTVNTYRELATARSAVIRIRAIDPAQAGCFGAMIVTSSSQPEDDRRLDQAADDGPVGRDDVERTERRERVRAAKRREDRLPLEDHHREREPGSATRSTRKTAAVPRHRPETRRSHPSPASAAAASAARVKSFAGYRNWRKPGRAVDNHQYTLPSGSRRWPSGRTAFGSTGSRGPMSGSQSRTVAELVETARARVIQIGLVYRPRLPSRPSEPIAVSQTRQAGPRRIASDPNASARVNPPR